MMAVAANSPDMAGMATLTLLPMKGVRNDASVATRRTVVLFILVDSIFNYSPGVFWISSLIIHI